MFARTATLLAVTAFMVLGVGDSTMAETTSAPPVRQAIYQPTTSSTPMIKAENATAGQLDRLWVAVERFIDKGLELPDLDVVFTRDQSACEGAKGLFTTDSVPWRVTFCSAEIDTVFEHELAHAWERANVSEKQRGRFMRETGYTVWRSHEVPWNQRAVEGVAVVIQQGVSGLPLPPALGSEAIERLVAFEHLTGRPDPRLGVWVRAGRVPCDDRPTAGSLAMPDAAGATCDLGRESVGTSGAQSVEPSGDQTGGFS